MRRDRPSGSPATSRSKTVRRTCASHEAEAGQPAFCRPVPRSLRSARMGDPNSLLPDRACTSLWKLTPWRQDPPLVRGVPAGSCCQIASVFLLRSERSERSRSEARTVFGHLRSRSKQPRPRGARLRPRRLREWIQVITEMVTQDLGPAAPIEVPVRPSGLTDQALQDRRCRRVLHAHTECGKTQRQAPCTHALPADGRRTGDRYAHGWRRRL